MKKITSNFTVFELVLLSFMAALGIAIKPFIMPLVYFIATPLLIPGGSLAGGFYMLWIILGASLINKPFSASLIGLMQAIMVIITGTVGSHGILSLVIYVVPGVLVDVVIYILKNSQDKKIMMFLACITANVSGLILTNVFIYNLPLIPLITSLSVGAVSGGIGGLISYTVYTKLINLKVFGEKEYGYEKIK